MGWHGTPLEGKNKKEILILVLIIKLLSKILATGCVDGVVRIFNAGDKDAKPIQQLKGKIYYDLRYEHYLIKCLENIYQKMF